MKTIAIFGAGIAGLSAAHELAQLGYLVSVYEATDQPGGFFRKVILENLANWEFVASNLKSKN